MRLKRLDNRELEKVHYYNVLAILNMCVLNLALFLGETINGSIGWSIVFITFLGIGLSAMISILWTPYIIFNLFKKRNFVITIKLIIGLLGILFYYFPLWHPLRHYTLNLLALYLVVILINIIFDTENQSDFETTIVVSCMLSQLLLSIPIY